MKITPKKLRQDYVENSRGNFSIIAAVTLPVIMLAIAVVVDISNLHKIRSNLNDASDAALMVGARVYQDRNAIRTKYSNKAAFRAARRTFTLHVKDEYGRVNYKPEYKLNGDTVVGTAEYTYRAPLFFAGLLGRKDQIIKGMSEVTFDLKNYVDITFLIDNSASLAVGATKDDQKLMIETAGCTFACHLPRGDWENKYQTKYQKAAGAKLRIDVVREAAVSTLNHIKDTVKDPDTVRVSFYTFSNNVEELVAPTHDFEDAIRKVQNLDLASDTNTSSNEFGGTLIFHSIKTITKALRRRVRNDKDEYALVRSSHVVLFTDGVENAQYFSYKGAKLKNGDKKYEVYGEDDTNIKNWRDSADKEKELQTFDYRACDSLKANGNEVYTVQTPYDVMPEMFNIDWARESLTFVESRETARTIAFERCASHPDNHFLTNDKMAIEAQFKKITDSIITENNLRLSQ